MAAFYDPEFETGKNGQYYDFAQAQSLPDEVSAKHDGTRGLLLSTNSGYAPRQAEVMQAQLAKIGIKVRIEPRRLPHVPPAVAGGAAVGPGAGPVGRRPRPR